MKLRILNKISFLNGLVFYAPVVYLIRENRGLHASEIFLLLSLSSLATLILEIPTGYITDKIGTVYALLIAQFFLFGTRLLFAFAGSFPVYVLEMIFFAVSQAFFSGTLSTFMYNINKEKYTYNMAKYNQYGTIGFFFSTVLFLPMMHISGYNLLILATVIASFTSFLLSLGLLTSKESVKRKEKHEVLQKFYKAKKPVHFFYFMYMKSVIGLIFLSINYFYVVNLLKIKIDVVYVSFIIIAFSILQMFAPKIIKLIKKEVNSYFACLIITIVLLFLQTTTIPSISILAMILLPLSTLILAILIDNATQKYVDQHNLDERRTTVLSMMNIGVVFFDFIFLLVYGNSMSHAPIDVLSVYVTLGCCLIVGSLFSIKIIKKYT